MPPADADDRADMMLAETRQSIRTALRNGHAALVAAPRELQQSVRGLPVYLQFVLAAVLWVSGNWAYNRLTELAPRALGYLSGAAVSAASSVLPTVEVSIGQLIVGFFGLLLGAVVSNTLTLIRMQSQLSDMAEDLETLADDDAPRTDGGESDATETTGGGALGGAIAGGALGASFGPGGALAGAFLGAIFGDEVEKSSRKNAQQPRDDHGRFK